jgi:hypothetical protein
MPGSATSMPKSGLPLSACDELYTLIYLLQLFIELIKPLVQGIAEHKEAKANKITIPRRMRVSKIHLD